jgi:D-aspartate ligase
MVSAVSNTSGNHSETAGSGLSVRGALVMGGDYRGLALVRSLGHRGIPVWVITQEDQRLAGASRYVSRKWFYPGWSDGGGVEFLIGLSRKYNLQNWMLLPTCDESVHLVATHHQELANHFKLTVPPWDVLQYAVDKHLMHQLAEKIGIDAPRTYSPRNSQDLASLPFDFPVILKPARRDRFNRLTAAKAWRANDVRTLKELYAEACTLLPPELLMIQEVIPGGGEEQFSFAAVCQDGRPLASLVARRTRQFPIDFGRASTFVETVEDPGIVEPSERFLEAVRYSGLIEVEFKRDPRTGRFKLLDANPRVWGWYSLCEASGVDFVYLLWLLLQGLPLPEMHARIGVRWMRLSTDLLASLGEIRGGQLSIPQYFRSLGGPHAPVIFATDDLRPGVLEGPYLTYLLLKRLMRGRGI